MSEKRVIWKYPLESILTTVEMPDRAEVVGFGHQGGQLVLWAQVYPEAGMVHRSFRVVGTGESHDADLVHRGLVQMPNGLVWHLLEDGAQAGGAR